jgi:hypothetical protein
MVKRALELFGSGDIAGARLFLQRAREAGSKEATYYLAQSYDPSVLHALGARGLVPDKDKARELYMESGLKIGAETLAKTERPTSQAAPTGQRLPDATPAPDIRREQRPPMPQADPSKPAQTGSLSEFLAAPANVPLSQHTLAGDAPLGSRVLLVVAGPNVRSPSELVGQLISVDDVKGVSDDLIRQAFATSGAKAVRLDDAGRNGMSRLGAGEVAASVIMMTTPLPPELLPRSGGYSVLQLPVEANR